MTQDDVTEFSRSVPGEWKIDTNPNGNESKKHASSKIGVGLAIGMGIGLALGAALDNSGVGTLLGAAVGLAIGAALDQQHKKGE